MDGVCVSSSRAAVLVRLRRDDDHDPLTGGGVAAACAETGPLATPATPVVGAAGCQPSHRAFGHNDKDFVKNGFVVPISSGG